MEKDKRPVIEIKDISKEFKVLNRREGLRGAIFDLFSRDYKFVKAVNHINMNIMPGEIVGYLGPNGAGKSTTIKMMTGVLEPTKGEIIVNGQIPYENRTKNAQHIGVVFGQRTQLWWALPAIESFRILKEIYKIDDKIFMDNLDYFDELVGASELYHKTVRQMSLGQRTLCDIIAAFLHNPSIVFLDEPTIGLDVSMKSKIRELIRTLNEKRNTTVVLTTHDMGDVDALCKRIIIIDKGIVLYDNSIEKLRGFFGAYRTMKLMFFKESNHQSKAQLEQIGLEIDTLLSNKFSKEASIGVTVEQGWINVLMNEDEVSMMQVLNYIQDYKKIVDVQLQEISTESVIKKIYDGGIG